MLYFRGFQSYSVAWKQEKTKQGIEVNPLNWTCELSHRRPHNNQLCCPSSYHTYLHSWKAAQKADQFTSIIFKIYLNSAAPRVVKSSPLLVKIAAYLFSISRLLCLAFLYRWRFLNKISLDWPLTLTTQPSTSKLSDNPEHHNFLHIPWCSIKDKHTCRFANRSSSFFGNINIFRELKYRWE